MIRAKMTLPNGRQTLVVGLSGENVTRLVAGKPIFARMEDTGFPGMDLVIIYGKTENLILRDINALTSLSENISIGRSEA